MLILSAYHVISNYTKIDIRAYVFTVRSNDKMELIYPDANDTDKVYIINSNKDKIEK